MVVEGGTGGGIRHFPARIDSLQKAEVSFRVPGKIKEILVREGDLVDKGQVLARLDDTDYRIALKDRQAAFDRARKEYERGKELIRKGYISRTDYDKLEAAYKRARARLEAARQDLAYTELKAPFDGTVAERLVEQYEQVQAKEPVFALSDTSSLKVIFDVPERIVQSIRHNAGRGEAPVEVSFESLPDQKFPVQFLEASTRADPQTQTFQITYTMPRPKGLNVLPGMTASVTVDLSKVLTRKQAIQVPLTAVTANARLKPIVWVVDEQHLVHAREVTLGELRGAEIEITRGLEPGMRIVTAGTPYLAEGMKVALLPEVEQAEPRPDDLRLILLTRCPDPAPRQCAEQDAEQQGR